MWDLSCPDWETRLRTGQSLIPTLPLFEDQARDGLAFFDEARLPDQPDEPRLGDAAGDWFRDLVRVAFGSWDPVSNIRWIRDIFLLAPKGQSKTSYFAGLIIALLLMNRRRNAQGLFVGPTQSISDRAYDQTVGMIELDPALKRRFRTIDHQKTIIDRITNTEAAVKTFDVKILTGGILIFALIDELHLLGRNVHTPKVLRQIRGGLNKTAEGLLLIATTQSDEQPAGAFKGELEIARNIRDGKYRGKIIRPLLPILYEFPGEIAKDPVNWQDPKNWHMVMPNLGRSAHLRDLVPDWETEKDKGEQAIKIWASQHLNIEIGLGIRDGYWPAAPYWESAADEKITLKYILENCDVAVVGIDGGGLDDLCGIAVIGREKGTGRWLLWNKAIAHPKVLEDRKAIAADLLDFEKEGDLEFVGAERADAQEIAIRAADIVDQVNDAGLLPDRDAIGLDRIGIDTLPDELRDRGYTDEQIAGITQGYGLSGKIATTGFKIYDRSLAHADQPLMRWCVANAKMEPRGNAFLITKQVSGVAKIDPLMATFNAVALMSMNPAAGKPEYQMFFV